MAGLVVSFQSNAWFIRSYALLGRAEQSDTLRVESWQCMVLNEKNKSLFQDPC